MRSEIRNIRRVVKYGAFGNSDAMGRWIYGKRRDGRTVACRQETVDGGRVQIWSSYAGDGPYMEEDMTEFTAEEWVRISRAEGSEQRWICNQILDARRK